VKWYTKAAEQGYAKAQYRLGSMYYDGEGIPQNYKTAAKWYTKAAGQGIASGQGILGLMYEYGDGVLTDNRRAYMWYNLASYNGSEQGGKSKDDMAKKMTPADISKAQDMSSLCLESNYTAC
jgi:TPR repeat protein